MKHAKFFLISVFIFSRAAAQELVFTEPVILDHTINSNAEEVYPLPSPDGKGLYFVRAFYKGNVGGVTAGQDIWYVERDSSGIWGYPNNLTLLNSTLNNVVVGISRDNNTLYLLNTYSNPLRWNYGIAYSRFEDGMWGKPHELDVKFNYSGPLRGYYVAPDEDVILMSSESSDTYGKEDLYIYIKVNEKWAGPIHLSKGINTEGAEISPFLSEDRTMLFFSSEGHGGFGSFDLFMTKRLDDTWERWSRPVNLGETINSPSFEAYLTTRAGETFFVSSKDGASTEIYMTKLSIREIEPDSVEVPDLMVSLPEGPEIVYTVQILAMPRDKEPKRSFFDRLADTVKVNMMKGKDGLDRFYVGEYPTLLDAFDAMESLRNDGYDDAFVRKLEEYSSL